MTTTTSVLSFPPPLILLIHLHILEYPHANKPEYDHNIFNSQTRGLRDRIKTLEDICYFLVGRLEGNARAILPTYPCSQPSDTVAFRTSLAKYFETLRHQSIYPSSKTSVGLGSKSGGKTDVVNNANSAWWWKDVLVRKSLLEECSGEKFERLLVSVSTHILLKCIGSSTFVLADDVNLLLRIQPEIYTKLLVQSRFTRQSWSQSAMYLLRRQDACKSLREQLKAHNSDTTSNYSYLETDRLVSLASSKLNDLQNKLWQDQKGRLALGFIAKIYGLTDSETFGASRISSMQVIDSTNPAIPPHPLPIAAAHHPGNLKKLRKPLFSSAKKLPESDQVDEKDALGSKRPGASRSIAECNMSDYLDCELATQREMTDALAKVKRRGQKLLSKAKTLENKQRLEVAGPTLTLWQPSKVPLVAMINFDVKPTPEFLSSLSLHPPSSEISLESHMDNIRNSLLPSYPTIPEFFGPRLPYKDEFIKSDTYNSKIPRANNQNHTTLLSRPRTLEPNLNPRANTSTPQITKINRKIPPHIGTTKSAMRGGNSGVPRKSIRLSLAASRPSLFAGREISDEDESSEDEINRIVRGTKDESTEEITVPVTPKAKLQPVNRIFTGTKGSTAKRPKQSYPMALHEPPIALPSLMVASKSFDGLLVDDDDDGSTDQGTPHQRVFDDSSDENNLEEYENEAPSMTLRDILLRADTTQFDLLDDEEDGFENESFGWD